MTLTKNDIDKLTIAWTKLVLRFVKDPALNKFRLADCNGDCEDCTRPNDDSCCETKLTLSVGRAIAWFDLHYGDTGVTLLNGKVLQDRREKVNNDSINDNILLSAAFEATDLQEWLAYNCKDYLNIDNTVYYCNNPAVRNVPGKVTAVRMLGETETETVDVEYFVDWPDERGDWYNRSQLVTYPDRGSSKSP